MGRPNKGVEHVDKVDAGRHEKDRLKAILRTVTGELSVQDACAQLGIRRAHFQTLRDECLQGAADALAPGRPGRPPLLDVEHQTEVGELSAENRRLKDELEKLRLRLELVEQIPGLAQRGQKGGSKPKAGPVRRRPKR